MGVLALGGPEVDAVGAAFREVTTKPVHAFDTPSAVFSALAAPGADWNLLLVPWSRRAEIGALRAGAPTLPLVVVAMRADLGTAGQAVAAGASDLLVAGEDLVVRVRVLLGKLAPIHALRAENRRLTGRVDARWALIGTTPALAEVQDAVARVARIPRPVVILGERGTGKELVARALHVGSGRKGALVAVNCAAFAEQLLEAELFGHERGAYTGADRRSAGRFEQADGGTLFLDEIGAMPLPFQQKILRVVEYGEVHRVGGSAPLKTDARVIAATNADLEQRVADGSFLADLWDRLAFEVIRVPPLRERAEDIPDLAQWFLDGLYDEAADLPRRHFSAEAMAELCARTWPGNVRELKHVVERAGSRPGPPEISASELGVATAAPGGGFHARVAAFERGLLARALARNEGNGAAAARELGLTYDQFRWFRKRLLSDEGGARGR